MKFKIQRTRFLEGLKYVQNVVASKGSLPILQNVLLEVVGKTLTLTTTDLDITVKSTIECECVEAGASTLPVKLLTNFIVKSPECDIEIEIDARDQAVIKANSARFKLNGKSKSEFPKMPEDEEFFEYLIEGEVFKNMLRKTSYAASQDDTRRTLKGVLMSFSDSKLTMVATDGRRLALIEHEMEFPANNEKDIVLPSKAVQELLRDLENRKQIKILVSSTRICFELEGVLIYSKLIDDAYPNYKQVIPKDCAEKIIIDRQKLLEALERASIMTMDEAHSTKLIFEMNKLVVTSAANDVGEAQDVVEIKYAGEKIEIMFNPSYVMDPLKAIDDDEIIFNLNDGHSPAVIKCNDPFIYVLMPLRIS